MSARLSRRSLLAGPAALPTLALVESRPHLAGQPVTSGLRVIVENRLSVIIPGVHWHSMQHPARGPC